MKKAFYYLVLIFLFRCLKLRKDRFQPNKQKNFSEHYPKIEMVPLRDGGLTFSGYPCDCPVSFVIGMQMEN